MNGFDWRALLRAGAVLGLKPGEFWRLTPVEFALLLGREGGDAPLCRSRLEELAAAFPDKMRKD